LPLSKTDAKVASLKLHVLSKPVGSVPMRGLTGPTKLASHPWAAGAWSNRDRVGGSMATGGGAGRFSVIPIGGVGRG
jgi:hypothetical protein